MQYAIKTFFGKTLGATPGYRPICLLNATSKLFERIITGRIATHMSEIGPHLCDDQFGFRKGRSTMDALNRARQISTEKAVQGEKALAVSLDVTNAFNSLLWGAGLFDFTVYRCI